MKQLYNENIFGKKKTLSIPSCEIDQRHYIVQE